jgi:putative SOS response-associated peptidase YedK
MPVMLVGEDAQSAWLDGSPDAAPDLLQPYPANEMTIVQRGTDRADLVD